MDYSRITLIGRVQPRDAETRYTAGGTEVLQFRVVVNNRVKKADGYEDHADWYQVSCFGRLAETVAKYDLAVKGARLFIDGRFSTRTWIDAEGRERLALEIVANDIVSLSAPSDRSEPSSPDSSSTGDLDDMPF